MATLTIRWVTMHDNNVCPVCLELERAGGWMFEVGKDEMGNELIHQSYGVVWDVARGSMAHEHGSTGKCRCHLEPEWDMRSWVERLTEIRDSLKASVREGESRGDAV